MKNFLLLLFMSLPLLFISCAEDMYEDSFTLEDLYRQKAAEFSQRYGVQIELNDEHLSEIIATKSIADLENDFRLLSSLNITLTEQQSPKTLKQKMRITRKKTLSEYDNVVSGSFNVDGSLSCVAEYYPDSSTTKTLTTKINTTCNGIVSWTYGNLSCSLSININNIAGYIGTLTFASHYPQFFYDESKRDISINDYVEVEKMDIGSYYTVKHVNCKIQRSLGQAIGNVSITTRPS